MSERPRAYQSIRVFTGLLTNADPEDIPPGASVVLENFWLVTPGEMQSRDGFLTQTLSGGNSTNSNDVIAGTLFVTPGQSWIVYQLSDGHVLAGYF
jgi:hypothetical protein